MTKFRTIFAVILLTTVADESTSHPSLTPHPHNSDEIELDGTGANDGEEWHNHMMFLGFGGINIPSHQPFSAQGCWDNKVYALGNIFGPMEKAHCFIDIWDSGISVTYSFEGTWDSLARDRVREAISSYHSLATNLTFVVPHGKFGNEIGISFVEVASGGDIEITWGNQWPDFAGLWLPASHPANLSGKNQLFFNPAPVSDWPGWDFTNDPSLEDDTKYHFLTVALHEWGHVIGLAHQDDSNDVMQDGPSGIFSPALGNPQGHAGRDPFYDVDTDSKIGVYNLYGQPPGSPPPGPCTLTFVYGECFGQTANPRVTVHLPGFGISNVDYDYRFGTGVWTDIFDGPLTCPSYSTTFATTARAIVTTLQGISQCTVYVPKQDCDVQQPE